MNSITFSVYEEEITNLLKKIPLLQIKQVILALNNMYEDTTESSIKDVLYNMQRKGHVLLSVDGWVMTKGAYFRLTNKSPDSVSYTVNNDTIYRLGNMTDTIENSGIYSDLIDCFWLVVDMLPDSKQFIVNETPWSIMFDTCTAEDKPCRLYQITRIIKDRDVARYELLKNLPEIDDNDNLRSNYCRIALIDDENDAWKVPAIGFAFICVLDSTSPKGYKIVEKRSPEQRWSYYEEN